MRMTFQYVAKAKAIKEKSVGEIKSYVFPVH